MSEYGILTVYPGVKEMDGMVAALASYSEQGWTVQQITYVPEAESKIQGKDHPFLMLLLARQDDSWPKVISEWLIWFVENCPLAGPEDYVRKFKEESKEFIDDPSMEEAVDCFATILAWTFETDDPRSFLQAVREKLEKVKKRKYERMPDGTYHHVKDPKDLEDAVIQITLLPKVKNRYPGGFTPMDVLTEIKKRWGQDAFPLVDVLDISKELQSIYGWS